MCKNNTMNDSKNKKRVFDDAYYLQRNAIKNLLNSARLDIMQHLSNGSTFRFNLEEFSDTALNKLKVKLKISVIEDHDRFEEDIELNLDRDLINNMDSSQLIQEIVGYLINKVKDRKHFEDSRNHPVRYISIRNKILIIKHLKALYREEEQ